MTAMNLPAQIGFVKQNLLPSAGKDPTAESYGLVNRFRVKVDQLELGNWASCSGLAVTFKPDELVNPGDYTSPAYLPGEITYGQVTLARAMEKKASQEVQKMLMDLVHDWTNWDGAELTYHRTNVTITLLDSQGAGEVVTWTLRDAFPTSWTGPELSGKSNEVAIEKLQFAHRGFLPRKNGGEQ